MDPLQTIAVPYRRNSAELFAHWARAPWSVFLDSGYPHGQRGRYDILAAQPAATIVTRGQRTEVRRDGHSSLSPADPFELVRQELAPLVRSGTSLPFCGGAIGYFGYDLGRRLECLPDLARDVLGMPELAVGIYHWCVLVDHHRQRSWLVAQPGVADTTLEQVQQICSAGPPATSRDQFQVRGEVHSNLDRTEYGTRFRAIKQYIHAGDCYQVNFAQRFSAAVDGSPWALYRVLREVNPAPYGAYLNTPGGQVLSLSPERFLRVIDGRVETQPIKGTRPRGYNPMHDQALAADLRDSDKDKAENLMIVDLLRNDLAKTCRLGSIAVPQLFRLRSFANVHHLVSTVTGRLRADRDALALLRGCFPGGSITGAPKLRAMEIIEELEPDRRGVYCGAIGYVSSHGTMDTSITIRTLVHRAGEVHFYAGGGIVADSQEENEYRECLDKVSFFLELLKRDGIQHVGG